MLFQRYIGNFLSIKNQCSFKYFFSLDPEQKQELIMIIQKLLADRTVLVIGSAVMAFTKVCPERVELIHHVFRKLCMLLVDVDEWGQVIIINMITRYARTQFADPNKYVRYFIF